MHARPKLRAVTRGTPVEFPVSAEILFRIHWLPQIVGSMLIFRAVVLLRFITEAREIMIKSAGCNFVDRDRANGRHSDVDFTARIVRRVHDRLGGDVRSEEHTSELQSH